jgi:hypothetical protein
MNGLKKRHTFLGWRSFYDKLLEVLDKIVSYLSYDNWMTTYLKLPSASQVR